MTASKIKPEIGALRTWSDATLILYPSLTMWIPIGVEAWMLATLLILFLRWLTKPSTDFSWLDHNQKAIGLALVAMFGIKMVSLLWSSAPAATLHNLSLFWHLLLYFPLLLVIQWCRDVGAKLIQGLRLSAWLGAALALWHLATHGWKLTGLGFAGATGNSLVLAVLFALITLMIFAQCLKARQRLDAWALVACVPVLVANGKRSLVLALFVCMLGMMILEFIRHKVQATGQRLSVRLWLLSCLVIFSLGIFTYPKWQLLVSQFEQYFQAGYQGGSIDTRLELYHAAWLGFLESPWLGSGAGTTRYVIEQVFSSQPALLQFNHFHNLILQQLSDLGIVGLSVWVLSLGLIHHRLTTIAHTSGCGAHYSARAIVPVMVVFGLTNLSFGNILIHMMFAFLLAVFASAHTTASKPAQNL